MGKVVHVDRVREFMKRTPVFRAKDVELVVGDKSYSSLLLHNLVRGGELKRITKGWYTISDDPVVSVLAFRPAYIGLQEALSLRELWEQETNVVIVTTLRVRPGLRSVMGSSVIIHRINQSHFFGIDYLRYDDAFLPVSDIEKTLIDLVYFNEVPGKDVVRDIARRTNRRRLREHLRHYPQNFRSRFWGLMGEGRLTQQR